MSTSQLSIDSLECPFVWQPEVDSSKRNLEDVIKNIRVKIEREPHKKAAYLTTLAYLFTKLTRVDFVESKKYLKEALLIDRDFQQAGVQNLHVSSEFVIRASLLHLKAKSKGEQFPLETEKIKDQLRHLNELWSDPAQQARAFGVKGVTFDCFGPLKYHLGVEALGKAAMLQPDNFHWLFGEAYIRARCSRQSYQQPADEYQLPLWNRARQLGENCEAGVLTTPLFYASYSQAILHNKGSEELCLSLADKAVAAIVSLPDKEQNDCHLVCIICLKIYRELPSQVADEKIAKKCSEAFNCLMQLAKRVVNCSKDPGLYLEISRLVDSNSEKLELLNKGKSFAGSPGHLWIELQIVELQVGVVKDSTIVGMLDSIRESFSKYPKNVSVVQFHKALLLMRMGKVQEAMSSCIAAVTAEPSLDQITRSKKELFFNMICERVNGFEEYLAWYKDNVADFDKRASVSDLYKAAEARGNNTTFTLEHFGRYCLKMKDFESAVSCFRKLPLACECKNLLLATALLSDPTSSSNLRILMECLQLGCRDAAPIILDLLGQNKIRIDTVRNLLANASSKNSTEVNSPIFFQALVYEILAAIDLTLESSSSFSLPELNKIPDMCRILKQRGETLIEVHKPMGMSNQSATETGERENLLRRSRLQMTKLYAMKASNPSQQKHEQEFNNLIVLVLKEAKEMLDRTLASFLTSSRSREFSYPHGFHKMKKQLDGSQKSELSKQSSESARKMLEMESVMRLLKEEADLVKEENVRSCLREAVTKIDSNFHQKKSTKDIFEFMVSREHRILSQEDCWIIRWIYLVNREKHSEAISVTKLDELLRSDWSGGGECKRTAYEVAHLAAEFAEETWAVFSKKLGANEGSGCVAKNAESGSKS